MLYYLFIHSLILLNMCDPLDGSSEESSEVMAQGG
jgi:hypothetical protein